MPRDLGFGVWGDDASLDSETTQVDTVSALVHRQLYLRGDPFEHTPAALLSSADEEEESEGEEERGPWSGIGRRRPAAIAGGSLEEQWAEESRVLKLAQGATGHFLWLRGRDRRANLLDQRETQRLRERQEALAAARRGPQRAASTPSLQPYRCWFRVEPTRPTAVVYEESLHEDLHLRPWAGSGRAASRTSPEVVAETLREAAARLPREGPARGEQPTWCWRADFVEEAKRAAAAEGMRHAFITKYTPGTASLPLLGYADAACSSGGLELWSPSFVALLEALRVRWGLVEPWPQGVRLAEEELRARQPEVRFPKPYRPPDPGGGSPSIRMPKALRDKLQRQGPPAPPPLPDRLPTQVYYKQELPWTRLLWQPEKKHLLPGRWRGEWAELPSATPSEVSLSTTPSMSEGRSFPG